VIDREYFRVAYRGAVSDVTRFITPERQQVLARHNAGLGPHHTDLRTYLEASERRYVRIIDQFNRQRPTLRAAEISLLDIGGFLGALPLALARCGVDVTLVEEYDYYYGAFDELKSFLEGAGVGVWAVDFTQPLAQPVPRSFTVVTNLAMLEHLASSPRALMANIGAALAADGLLFVDVPNIAYWPNRLKALRGNSIHQPLEFMYESEPPFLGHHREYTVAELTALLTWGGFRVLETEVFNYTPTPHGGSARDRILTLLAQALPTLMVRDAREVILAVATPARTGPPAHP